MCDKCGRPKAKTFYAQTGFSLEPGEEHGRAFALCKKCVRKALRRFLNTSEFKANREFLKGFLS